MAGAAWLRVKAKPLDNWPSEFLTFTVYVPSVAVARDSRTTICCEFLLRMMPFPTKLLPKKIWSIAPAVEVIHRPVSRSNVVGDVTEGLMLYSTGDGRLSLGKSQ